MIERDEYHSPRSGFVLASNFMAQLNRFPIQLQAILLYAARVIFFTKAERWCRRISAFALVLVVI
jgi:hypothetical protein